ncbi:D-alanyl-D-alanine carboxypeptidase family protein [Chelativorans sp. AA-79]|uniref:D-alanyl-D-alanine carboxypeptidase family protein n=1 Tax=Chelativorans sp. AA-79 TaxID=3028735 RepID=UPI0023F7A418|nr:D-alanyl-D-alanine carboxypeptidase family protein [Chelativorans sp. AA-79]WEX11732.1 D-alanyl-D-alanine carboxypeptidase [Chelativorans sp. AA-79]
MGVVVRQALAGKIRQFCNLATVALAVGAFVVASAATAAANPKYAGIVVDAKTGKVLYEDNADASRYPASLTKMMTLYLVFEALSTGRISKNTRVTFSANAAKEPPTKLGVKAGNSITVEQAILALITRSANDAATAVAEHLGGSEAGFARMMTAKARQLGMNSTTFRNAHGLPNSEQRTTARDMARLGIALREHFPQYYDYFSTRSFVFAGKRINGHNNLLGRVKGADGIKTGYIRASGFNLVSSVSTGNRQIVAVVLGGRTARARDAHMVDLIQRTLPKASTGRSRDLIAKAPPIKPAITNAQPVLASVAALPKQAPLPPERPEIPVTAYADDPIPSAKAALAEAVMENDAVDPVATASTPVSGWVIQVASTPTEEDARRVLTQTADRASNILSAAKPFTETFVLKGQTYYRARFGGFESKTAAWDACASLKKKSVDCYAVQN